MARVLILSNERVGVRMAGPAIRCFELARVLHAAGHEVTLGTPTESDLAPQPFAVAPYAERTLRPLLQGSDVVLLQGWVLERFPVIRDCGARLVVDLYDPFPLEVLIQSERRPLDERIEEQRYAVRAVSDQLRDGDFFVCASEKQRDFWLGWLCALNRVNPHTYAEDASLRRLVDVVPFGIPVEAPVRRGRAYREVLPGIDDDDLVVLWGGGVYNWFDPMTLVRGVALAAPDLPTLRLVFMSTGHPNPLTPRMWTMDATRALAAELGLTGRHVFFNEGWVEYDRRADWFLEADIGVSTHFDHVETAYSFRTRVLDYLWAGLPVLTTAGDTLGDEVERRGLGRAVPAEDDRAVAGALLDLGRSPERRAECAARVAEYAAALTWERAAAPLLRYLESLSQAPDLAAVAPLRRVPVALRDLAGDADAPHLGQALERVLALGRRWTPRRLRSAPATRRAVRALRRLGGGGRSA